MLNKILPKPSFALGCAPVHTTYKDSTKVNEYKGNIPDETETVGSSTQRCTSSEGVFETKWLPHTFVCPPSAADAAAAVGRPNSAPSFKQAREQRRQARFEAVRDPSPFAGLESRLQDAEEVLRANGVVDKRVIAEFAAAAASPRSAPRPPRIASPKSVLSPRPTYTVVEVMSPTNTEYRGLDAARFSESKQRETKGGSEVKEREKEKEKPSEKDTSIARGQHIVREFEPVWRNATNARGKAERFEVDRTALAYVQEKLVGTPRTGDKRNNAISRAIAASKVAYAAVKGFSPERLPKLVNDTAFVAVSSGLEEDCSAIDAANVELEIVGSDFDRMLNGGARPCFHAQRLHMRRLWYRVTKPENIYMLSVSFIAAVLVLVLAWLSYGYIALLGHVCWDYVVRAHLWAFGYVVSIFDTVRDFFSLFINFYYNKNHCAMEEVRRPTFSPPNGPEWAGEVFPWAGELTTEVATYVAAEVSLGPVRLYNFMSFHIVNMLSAIYLLPPCKSRINLTTINITVAFLLLFTLVSLLGKFLDWIVPWWVSRRDQAYIDEYCRIYNEENRLDGSADMALAHGTFRLLKKDYPYVFDPELPIVVGSLDYSPDVGFNVIAPIFRNGAPAVPKSSNGNEILGLAKRVYNNPIKADESGLASFSAYLTSFLSDEFKTIEGCVACQLKPLEEDPHAAVYAEWNSVERVGKSNALAHDAALEQKAVTGPRPRDYDVVGFVKEDPSFHLNVLGVGEPSPPRIVMNVSQLVHTTIGPFMYAFAKLVAKLWNPGHWLCYASGTSTQQNAAFVTPGPAYVGDVSRFDRGLHEKTLATLHEWRVRTGDHIPCTLTNDALAKQLDTTGVTLKGHHKYKFRGQRRSGDDNTSVDNTVINIAAHVWAIHEHTGFDLATIRSSFKLLALGDDIVITGPPVLFSIDFKAILSRIGWSIKPKYVNTDFEVEFCSMWRWPSSGGPIFSAKPGRLLSRFGFTWNCHTVVNPGEKAYGLLLGNNHVPFVRVYLRAILAMYPVQGGVDRLPEWQMARPANLYEPTIDTWNALYSMYGLTQEDENDFARWLTTWQGGPAIGAHYAVTRMFAIEDIAQPEL